MTSIKGIDIVAVAVLPTAIVATIEWKRILSARLRRTLSRRRHGSAPSHPSYSSTSVTSVAASAATHVVPQQVLVVRSLGLSQMMAGAMVPLERPPRQTHLDSGDRGSGDGSGNNGIGGGSRTDRDNNIQCRWQSPLPSLSSWGGDGRHDDDDGGQKGG